MLDCPMCPSAGFHNGRLHLFACSDLPVNHQDLPPQIFDDEAIEIEGDPKYLIALLETWIKEIKMVQDHKNAHQLTEHSGPRP